MLKVIENCGADREVTEKALIKELFSPATCNHAYVDELAKKLEPKSPSLILMTFSNSSEQ